MRPLACLAAIMALGLAILLPSALAAADEGGVVAPSGNTSGQVSPQPPKDIADCNVLSQQSQDSRPLLISGLSIGRDQNDPSFLMITASLSNDQYTTYVVDTLCLGHSGLSAILEGGPPLGFSGPEISDEYLVFTTKTVSLEPGDSVQVEFVLREDTWEPGELLSLTWVGESNSVLAHLDLLVPRPAPSTEPTPTPTETPTPEPTKPTTTPTETPTKPTSTPTATESKLPTHEPTDAPIIVPSDKPTTPAPSPTVTETEPTESSSPSGQISLGPCYPAWWYPTCAPTPTAEPPTEILTEDPTFKPTETPTVLPPTIDTSYSNPIPTPSASPTISTRPSAPPTISTRPPAPPTSPTSSAAPSNTPINNPPMLVILPATSRPTAAPTSRETPTSLETDVPTLTPGSSPSFTPIPPLPDPVAPPKPDHSISDVVASPIATAVAIVGIATVTGSGLIVIRRVGVPRL